MVFNSGTCDALYDAIRAMKKCPTDQWEEFKAVLDMDASMPRDNHNILRNIVRMADNGVPHRGEREHPIEMDSEDDCYIVEDPQCVEKSRPEKERENELRSRNMCSRCVELAVQSKPAPGPRPDDLVQAQCGYGVQALSNRKRNVDTVLPLDKATMFQNSSKRFNLGMETRYKGDDQNARSKDDKVEREDTGKNVVKGDHVAVVQKPGPRNNDGTKNQIEHIDRARTHDKCVMVYKRRSSEVVEGGNKSEVNCFLTNDQIKLGIAAGPEKKDEVENPRKLKKVVGKGTNTAKEDDVASNDCQRLKPVSRNVKRKNVAIEDVEGGRKSVVQSLGSRNEHSAGVAQSQQGKKDKHDESQDLGVQTYADFRTRVLEVLNMPYDGDEYKRHRKTFKAKKYLDSYPDLKSALIKRQFNRGKCLAIVRGFLFWLENSGQEGAFMPWIDDQCLNVPPNESWPEDLTPPPPPSTPPPPPHPQEC